MAATRLMALHINKGKSVAACLKARTDYAQNPDKTEQGELVSSYECSPLTVYEEFLLSKRQYERQTGRRQKNDVIAYQIRQSFRPGEVLVSLMRQYTPMGNLPAPYDRRITDEEYDGVLSWMFLNELEGFTQEKEAADAGFIPDFH